MCCAPLSVQYISAIYQQLTRQQAHPNVSSVIVAAINLSDEHDPSHRHIVYHSLTRSCSSDDSCVYVILVWLPGTATCARTLVLQSLYSLDSICTMIVASIPRSERAPLLRGALNLREIYKLWKLRMKSSCILYRSHCLRKHGKKWLFDSSEIYRF